MKEELTVNCFGQSHKLSWEDGKITELKLLGDANPNQLIVMPLRYDPHVHDRGGVGDERHPNLREAMLRGGVGMIAKMPNPKKAITSMVALEEAVEFDKALGLPVNYWFGLTCENLAEVEQALQHPLVIGVKVYWGSTTGDLLVNDPRIVLACQRLCVKYHKPMAYHAEDETIIRRNLERFKEGKSARICDHPDIRSTDAELLAVVDICGIADMTGCQTYFCHISTRDAADHIFGKRMSGCRNILAEVCPHHFIFNRSLLESPNGGRYKMNPPLRDEEIRYGLEARMLSGEYFQVVSTDHAPHRLELKQDGTYLGTPSGVPGIEECYILMAQYCFKGKMSWRQLANYVSWSPAKILFGKPYGEIAVGADANFVLIDPSSTTRFTDDSVASYCGWTAYGEREYKGKIVATVHGGEVIYSC